MIDNQNNVQTSVQQVDLDIDSWLGAPGADSIVTPVTGNPTGETTELKPNIFSKQKQDLSFLDKEDDEDDSSKDDEKTKTPKIISKEETNHLIDNLDLEEDEETKGKAGRPKTDKSGLVGFLKKRIESKEMFAFDDYDETKQDLEEYLGTLGEKDIEELWQANVDNMKSEVAAKTPQEFFESLPEELQYAAKYVADGGQDLKGLFRTLAQVEEMYDLDPTIETHQAEIARQYLYATNFGTAEEIEAEIEEYYDMGRLQAKANQFKPKLDRMQEEVVARKLAEQEHKKEQQAKQAKAYTDNVYKTLEKGDLAGIKMDRKTQSMLYSGLVQPNFPSISGKPIFFILFDNLAFIFAFFLQ